LTEVKEEFAQDNNIKRFKKLNIRFDITNLILGFFAAIFCLVFPFANWWSYKGLASFVVFGFPLLYGDVSSAPWFYNYFWTLFILLCLCFLLAIFSLNHTLDKEPLLKSKMLFSIIGLLLSGAIIVLISLMAVAFFKYSAEVLTYEIRTLSFSFYTSLIYAVIVFCFSLTQLVLSFRKKALPIQS